MGKVQATANIVRLEIAEFLERCEHLVDDDREGINSILKGIEYDPDRLEDSAHEQSTLGSMLAWYVVKMEELAEDSKLAMVRLADREKDKDHADEKGKPLPQWRIESQIRSRKDYQKLEDEHRQRAKLARLLDKLTWSLRDRGELLRALITKEQSRSSR